jgi:hypothetical protein
MEKMKEGSIASRREYILEYTISQTNKYSNRQIS